MVLRACGTPVNCGEEVLVLAAETLCLTWGKVTEEAARQFLLPVERGVEQTSFYVPPRTRRLCKGLKIQALPDALQPASSKDYQRVRDFSLFQNDATRFLLLFEFYVEEYGA